MPRDGIDEMWNQWFAALPYPPRMSLADWSSEHARLEKGERFRPFPFQRGIADAMTDPDIEQITVQKSARVGYSSLVRNLVGYHVAQDPLDLLIYQPTVEDAEDYAKTDIDKLLAWPAVAGIVPTKARSGANTITKKRFPGGSIRVHGANSPRAFRRISVDVVILEEPDGYPAVAGLEGDQVELAWMRAHASDRPKLLAGSTPTIQGASRIEGLFEASDQRHRWVPCPNCRTHQVLILGGREGPGIKWEPFDEPNRAWYECGHCQYRMTWDQLPWMDERGEWVASKPEVVGHAGFHVWQAYSQLPKASWLNIARGFVRTRPHPQKFKVFTNQVLGKTYEIKGEAPDWKGIYDRREEWPASQVPDPVTDMTVGMDVQKDRVEAALWGWGRGMQSWLIDHGVFMGNPETDEPWDQATEWLARPRVRSTGEIMPIRKVAVDTGHLAPFVIRWVRKHSLARVTPIRGAQKMSAPIWSAPKAQDHRGQKAKKVRRGVTVIEVGGHILKIELYGNLARPMPSDEEIEAGRWPDGFIHLPKWAGEEHVQQLTAESWDEKTASWIKHRANEQLDMWCYARAAAHSLGLDMRSEEGWTRAEAALGVQAGGGASPPTPESSDEPRQPRTAKERAAQWAKRMNGG